MPRPWPATASCSPGRAIGCSKPRRWTSFPRRPTSKWSPSSSKRRLASGMDERLEDFVQLLRQNGLRISPAEVADATQAAVLVGLADRPSFRGALRATLVKRGQDAAVFDRLFEIYFTGAKDLIEGLQGSLLDALEKEKLTELDLEEIARQLSQLSPMTQALAFGRSDQLARILRQATLNVDFRGLSSPLQRGFYTRRLFNAAGGTQAEKELQQLLGSLRARGVDPEAVELL